jgi:hypothetical protein
MLLSKVLGLMEATTLFILSINASIFERQSQSTPVYILWSPSCLE